MFDFAWSEIGLIAAVALVLIGPKDMPVAIRAVTDMIKKARRMAGEFQTHVDDMLREANLGEVRDQIGQLRNFDIRSEVERAIDPDRSIRDTFASNPLDPASTQTVDGEVAVAESPAVAELEHEHTPPPAEPAKPDAPAFVPPSLVPALPAVAHDKEVPAFIPPGIVLQPSQHPRA
ncbi:MAG TPA: Sec-independent protein translocase protein TatB [Acetobacteraceae bacterium]|jgi:sec-independent protein translocase protein TatB